MKNQGSSKVQRIPSKGNQPDVDYVNISGDKNDIIIKDLECPKPVSKRKTTSR